MATGSDTVDFGAFPGSTHATKVVTGQAGILSGSKVEAWINNIASADHSADEHMIEPIKVGITTIVAGTGFTVEAHYVGSHDQDNWPGLRDPNNSNANAPRAYGVYNIFWAWS